MSEISKHENAIFSRIKSTGSSSINVIGGGGSWIELIMN